MNAFGSKASYLVLLVQLLYLFVSFLLFLSRLVETKSHLLCFYHILFCCFSPPKHLNSMSPRMKKLSFAPPHCIRLTEHLLTDPLIHPPPKTHSRSCIPSETPCCFIKLPAVCLNLNPKLGFKLHLCAADWDKIGNQTGKRRKQLNVAAKQTESSSFGLTDPVVVVGEDQQKVPRGSEHDALADGR